MSDLTEPLVETLELAKAISLAQNGRTQMLCESIS